LTVKFYQVEVTLDFLHNVQLKIFWIWRAVNWLDLMCGKLKEAIAVNKAIAFFSIGLIYNKRCF
jgi:hypothetical protein